MGRALIGFTGEEVFRIISGFINGKESPARTVEPSSGESWWVNEVLIFAPPAKKRIQQSQG
jgi:hypothetical protein